MNSASMEPMNLGTPSNSGPSSPATTPSGSPYLPSFLLGEPTSPLPGSTSPQLKRGNLNDAPHFTSPRFLANQTVQHALQSDHSLGGEKSSGPPIRGLFDTVTSPVPLTKSKQGSAEANAYISSVSRQFHDVRSPSSMHETADTTWVTVFGYPPAAAGFILSQIANCGRIIGRESPASGNWMHVQFSSKLEAKRALACNGKVFAGSVMVGVVPCRDQGVLERALEHSSADLTSTSAMFASPRSPRSPGSYLDQHRSVDASVYDSPYGSPRISQARPLVARHDSEIYGSGNTPQKSSGIVSKAMEYILGW